MNYNMCCKHLWMKSSKYRYTWPVENFNMLEKRILLVSISPWFQRKSDICFSCRTSCYVVGWCHEMTKKATKTQKLSFMFPEMLIILLLKFLHLSFIKVQFKSVQKHLARYRTEGYDQNSSFTWVKKTNMHALYTFFLQNGTQHRKQGINISTNVIPIEDVKPIGKSL